LELAMTLIFKLPPAFSAALLITAALIGPVSAQTAADGDKVVARVDGAPITEKDLALAAEDLSDRLGGASEAQKREDLISYVIDLRLGTKAANDAKIAESPEFARKFAYLRDKILLDEFLTREAKKAVTPEAAKKLYEDTIKDLKPEAEVRARHILLENEDDAKKALARVQGGEDFAKVAAELSKDPGSGKEGGDLGFFSKERMVPEFAEAAFKLEPGQIGGPVKSQFGFHVIKVEEKRTKPVPGFDDVKDQIDNYLRRKALQDTVLALRAKGKVERLDQEGKAEAPKEPAAKEPAKK
jgi:peptidyl-prolyl cis-trans isomerase C